jgi:hypothetical protein
MHHSAGTILACYRPRCQSESVQKIFVPSNLFLSNSRKSSEPRISMAGFVSTYHSVTYRANLLHPGVGCGRRIPSQIWQIIAITNCSNRICGKLFPALDGDIEPDSPQSDRDRAPCLQRPLTQRCLHFTYQMKLYTQPSCCSRESHSLVAFARNYDSLTFTNVHATFGPHSTDHPHHPITVICPFCNRARPDSRPPMTGQWPVSTA